MAVNQTFHPCENVALDLSAPPFSCLRSNRPVKYTAAALAQPRFLDSYLAFRIGPRHRPDPRRPYASLDVLVLDALKSAHESSRMTLSPRQLMDAVVLFPAKEVSCLLQGRGDELVAPLSELIAAVDAGEEDPADGVDVILGTAFAGCGKAVVDAFCIDHPQESVADCIRRWHDVACVAGCTDETLLYLENAAARMELSLSADRHQSMDVPDGEGVANPSASRSDEAAVALVRELIPDASVESITAALKATGLNVEATVGILLESNGEAGPSSGPNTALVPVGKRTARRREVRDVTATETFTGDKAEEDGGYGWLQSRIDAELARQATIDPDDPRDRTGAYTYLVDAYVHDGPSGMYDDDPDDALLEGEDAVDMPLSSRQFSKRGGESNLTGVSRSRSDVALSGADELYPSDSSNEDDERDSGVEVDSEPVSGECRGQGSGARSSESGGPARGGGGRGSGGRGRDDQGRGRGRGRGRGSSGGAPRGRGGRGGANFRRDAAMRKQSRAGM
jgi:hypothetical protein